MPPKAKQVPQPIDRPLSRAYLRQFGGWSTAYPPGLSDPTSLRIMENVQVNRDGSVRIRPGLKYLSYDVLPVLSEDGSNTPGTRVQRDIVGTHEAFYGADGGKCYLFAVREADNTVGFRALIQTPAGQVVTTLTDTRVGFTTLASNLNFSAATKYVKYLQIDNKVFALSDAGEPMRLFYVGATKTAKALGALTRPSWNVADKLSVVHPDAGWVTAGAPTGVRTNQLTNPDFETNVAGYTPVGISSLVRDTTVHQVGAASMRVDVAQSVLTNLFTNPRFGGSSAGGWTAGGGGSAPSNIGGMLYVTQSNAGVGGRVYANGPRLTVTAGKKYWAGCTVHRLPMYDVSWGAGATGFLYRWYNAADAQIGSDVDITASVAANGIRSFGAAGITAPAGATGFRMFAYTTKVYSSSFSQYYCEFYVKDTYLVDGDPGSGGCFAGSDTDTTAFDYAWTGTANASTSTRTFIAEAGFVSDLMVTTPGAYTYSTYIQSPAALNVDLKLYHYSDAAGTALITTQSATVATTTGLARYSVSGTAPAGTIRTKVFVKLPYTTTARSFWVDAGLFERAASMGTYFSGATTSTSTLVYAWSATAHGSVSTETTWSTGVSVPPAETPTVNTLVSSTSANNIWNFGFFYTFENEVGESAASQITTRRTQRSWGAWRWETPNAAGEPSGTATTDPTQAADQLVAIMPQAVFDAAVLEGAVRWSLYAFTWSDQDPVPVSAVKIASKDLPAGAAYGTYGWIRMTPVLSQTGQDIAVLPNDANRYNYSDPSKGGQGLVASDRMVVVKDPTASAVIRWSGNNQGDYSNFSASKGGGYKTLTSGNLMIPACVKLWQNPQSVDTLTILCLGTDGNSTGYYMAPAAITSQSEQTNIMGFEETTATPGTTSPYGVEVFNNALYHPLDDQLMKSTANNYNISHKSQTDQIRDQWEQLTRKQWIVSSMHDSRLYYVVNNPDGAPLEAGCNGNELWIYDAGTDTGTWSRLMIQAQSLRRIEQGGRIYMSVVRPDGIFYLDPEYAQDDYVNEVGQIAARPITWKLETNTQGANRAHDAWAHLQQANIVLGYFQGFMVYGLHGHDVNGMDVRIEKMIGDNNSPDGLAFDIEDYFRIARDMKEWFFYARSATLKDVMSGGDETSILPSYGQLNLVQYRYAPISVNVGYEYGSVETFEYGQSMFESPVPTTDFGVPKPYVDTGRP